MSPRKAKPPETLVSEHTEQVWLFQWASNATVGYPELASLFAIPNFARLTPRWGAYMKAEGKRAGVPDICLPVARKPWHALYVELKAGKNKCSPEQTAWHSLLGSQGNCVLVCYGFEAAKKAILEYLSL